MAEKIRTCAYARVSTLSDEQDHSLAAQTKYYKELIENDPNAVFVGIYADKKSGKDVRNRPRFTEMIKAAKRGEIDRIITKSISRFARNILETLRVIRELREIGVGVTFEKENIDSLDVKSDFILSIYSIVAESELTSMSEQVKWAARKRFKQGSVELNSNIYGYTLKDGQLVPVPEEAEVVKYIFKQYCSGVGIERIAKNLNENGVKLKKSNGLWRPYYITRMLRNEKYIGDALLQKRVSVNFKLVKNNGVAPQYYVENNHQPIISRDLFEKAQRILNERKRKGKAKELSPFSSKIICLACGKTYTRRKNNRNTPYEKWIWSCRTYVRHGRKCCGAHSIKEKDLKELFVSAYNEATNYKSNSGDLSVLEERLKALLAQERELFALKAKGYISSENFDAEHKTILNKIKETENEYAEKTRDSIKLSNTKAETYEDRLVADLSVAEIDGYNICFKFKNGAKVMRQFTNEVDRRETWRKKLGRE